MTCAILRHCLASNWCDPFRQPGVQEHRTSDINTSVSLAGFGNNGVRTWFQSPRR